MIITAAILFFLSLVILAFSANVSTGIFCFLCGGVIVAGLRAFTHKKDTAVSSVYAISFAANTLYAVLCYAYMQGHGYSYLLAFDTDNVIMPTLNGFLSSGQGFWGTIGEIWSQYDLFDRFQVGYYTYLFTWGYFTNSLGIGIDNYFAIQMAHYAFASFIAPLLYKILVMNNVSYKKAVSYSLTIAFCSIMFFYSSTIIRDGIITTLMLYIYYVMMHEPKMLNYLKIFLAVYLISALRIESGMFAVVYLPFYYYIWMGHKGRGNSYLLAFLIVAVVVLAFAVNNYSRAVQVYNFNYDTYVEGVDEGSGVIGLLQRIPVLGNLLSIVYIAMLPMPCWSKMFVSASLSRPECYNVMCFPIAIAVFFNTYIIVYLILYALSGKRQEKKRSRPLMILLIPGLALLYLQSAVVAQRRVMAAYAVFYLIWAMIHEKSSKKFNHEALVWTGAIFLLIQLATGLR